MRVLYDVVNKKEIEFEGSKDFLEKTGFKLNYKILWGKSKCAYGRFILPERMDEIFTLMDIDTGEKFDIFDANTLSFYLGEKLSKKDTAYLSSLKTSKTILTKIKGRTFKNLNGDPRKAKARNKHFGKKYKDSKKVLFKNWREANIEAEKERSKKWKAENKDRIREYNNNYAYQRRRNDPNFKLRSNLRSRMNIALRNTVKSNTTMKLVGCSTEFLKGHLEAKFTKGMNWENYGEWHVDHIIPCSYYDLTKPENQRECFHYTNLQPLWAKDNMDKRAQLPEDIIPEPDSKTS
jgi:hypothetical protein